MKQKIKEGNFSKASMEVHGFRVPRPKRYSSAEDAQYPCILKQVRIDLANPVLIPCAHMTCRASEFLEIQTHTHKPQTHTHKPHNTQHTTHKPHNTHTHTRNTHTHTQAPLRPRVSLPKGVTSDTVADSPGFLFHFAFPSPRHCELHQFWGRCAPLAFVQHFEISSLYHFSLGQLLRTH